LAVFLGLSATIFMPIFFETGDKLVQEFFELITT